MEETQTTRIGGKDDTRSGIRISCMGCKMEKILVKHKRKMNKIKKER